MGRDRKKNKKKEKNKKPASRSVRNSSSGCSPPGADLGWAQKLVTKSRPDCYAETEAILAVILKTSQAVDAQERWM